ncbi:MAG: right-handed parallel beta-helix repeat-containing protein [Planctomycetes bacterium]|nr:right-handed parallel beta-helix repeat-containing protein [Planctomycetota bacterium]
MLTNRAATLALVLAALTLSPAAVARDIYVSSETGQNNNPGTKEAPKKLLWRVLSELQPGDRVHVAAGTYHGQGKTGVMPKIETSDVVIQGGWNADFSQRDPFRHLTIISPPGDQQGAGKTVFHAERSDNNLDQVTIDGFCIDRGTGNYYFSDGEPGANQRIQGHVDNTAWGYQALNVKKSGSDTTVILVGKGRFTVRNMIIVNSPWWGIYVKCGGAGETLIENNLVLIAGSRGIEAIVGGGWGKPTIRVRNNTIAFVHTFGSDGRGLSVDPKADNGQVVVENNVIAFCDEGGVTSKFAPQGDALVLRNNQFFFCKKADFNVGGNGLCNAGDFEDELTINDASGNVHALPAFPARMHQAWVDKYTAREVDYLAGGKITQEEIMAVRQSIGLSEYRLHGYDRTFPDYRSLPQKRPNYSHGRYPHPMTQGSLIDFAATVTPIIGADGERGVRPIQSE